MQIENQKIAIEVHNLTVSYERKPVLWDIDFNIPEGKLAGIIGPNGSGKTTLLKSIMGLLKSDSGYIKIFGENLSEIRNRVSYVPQRESVDWDFPANVLDVVLMGRYTPKNILRSLSKTDHEIAWESLKKVGMQDFAKRQISKLSGGQQQRVFIARSLAQKADLYIMDEPFAGVDAATENSILKLLQEMKSEGKTVVVVHHDLESAKRYFDWMILINTRLVTFGDKEKVFTEENLLNTYGGKSTILSKLGQIIKEQHFPIREKDVKDQL